MGYSIDDYISAPKLFDNLSNVLNNYGLSFDYIVLADNDNVFQHNEEAFTVMSSGIIYFKESVMEQACRRRYKRGTFTLVHELGHYLLHYL